ncbi:FtsX-like permease family protein [Acutalibacter sp. 1XD8-33]|uniref:FtsX-like permease family protein n=1 Tax=Acutalibacter sp. 1XD8-33 TaxID=2320081 RepID=UPI000EA24268|nr:FtsX-like permease family protein [Acutalibacter sp. 1XD8-33]RKJ39773.1 FtsX-like permease family protein [Acutalibacter sp. 1XD8-33]
MTWPFENDTSAVEKKLARRSIKADKRRSAFVILTIALAVSLMGTLCFLYSAQQLKTLDGILGQYQAGCGGLTREEVARLVGAGKFEKWGCTVEAGTARHEDSVLQISYVSPEMIDLMGYGAITGTYPQEKNELCVERAFFRYFGLPEEVGQTVALDLGDGQKSYTVTGILEAENGRRIFTVWIPEAAVDAESPYELRFRFAGSKGVEPDQLQTDIDQFFAEMGIPEEQTFYSSSYFGMVDLYLGNGMEVYAAALLIAAVCAIVIYNIFYISVMGKMREYGRLKVLGTTPRQLGRVVKRERRFLTAIAIPLGLICAAGIVLIAVPGYWSWGDNLRSAVVVSLLTYGTVLIATRKPMAMAGKVSAIEAIRATACSRQQGPSVSRQLHRRLTMPRLAWMNFSRNRKKAFVTTLSLGLTGILLLCVSAYANSVDVKEMAQSQFGDRSQYLLQYEDFAGREFVEMQKENPLGQTLREGLAALPGVDHVTAYSLTCVEIPAISAIPGNSEHEPFVVRGISQEDMAEMYAGNGVLEGTADYQQLLDGDGILVCPAGSALNEIYRTSYQVGDTVTLSCYNGQSKTYTVMGIVQDVQIGSSTHFFILPEAELSVLYPEISDFTGYVNLHTERDSGQLRRAVFSAVSDQRVAVSGLDDLAVELERGLRGELARDYGILVFIFAFSLINLANTLITNLLTRQQEFGVFQSVGMSDRQLSNMLSFECLYYVGITLLVTLTLGTVCSLAVCRVFDRIGMFGTLTYHFPALQVLLFGAALLLVQGVFSACAVRYTRSLSLVERIKAAD